MTLFEFVVQHACVATAVDVFDCDIGVAGRCIVAPTPRPPNRPIKELAP